MAIFSSFKNFSALYFGLVAVYMSSVLFEMPWLHGLVKPLFMVVLIMFQRVMLKNKMGRFSKLIEWGLFFSWLGDIALIFDDRIPIFFVVGLSAFLIAHLGYSAAFLINILQSPIKTSGTKKLALALPFVLITGLFFWFMKDGIPANLFNPVLAYTIVISAMGIAAAIRYKHVKAPTYKWILLGAIFFILSDMVIAINKFVVDFPYDAILNMFLYLPGQFMITVGAIYFVQQQKSPATIG